MRHTTPCRTTDTISLRVVEAIADADGTDPVDMEPPLFEAINPEALDRLFRSGTDCAVRFQYEDHTVEVHSDGTVTVDGTTWDRP